MDVLTIGDYEEGYLDKLKWNLNELQLSAGQNERLRVQSPFNNLKTEFDAGDVRLPKTYCGVFSLTGYWYT